MVQVEDDGEWEEVRSIHPRSHWAVDLVDLSGYLQGNEKDVRLKLYWTAHHKIDYAGLMREVPAQSHAQPCSLLSAVHSTEGSVTDRLDAIDQWYAELVPQDTLTLSFSSNPVDGNKARDFVLVARGHYVMGDSMGGPLPKALSITPPELPSEFFLSQNYPNPFNPVTTIRYALPEARSQMQEARGKMSIHVTLKIYNLLGQEVRTLVGLKEAGYYTVIWDSQDDRGLDVSSGIYFYRLSVDSGRWADTKRMVLLK